jgi:hypothetical protein
MPEAPRCSSLGSHCRELSVTLRIADRAEDRQTFLDAAGTWLLGHTEHITMDVPHFRGSTFVVNAVLHVPCKHLRQDGGDGNASARCAVHGFRGPSPRGSARPKEAAPGFRRSDGKFDIVFKGKRRPLHLPLKRAAQRALPVMQNHNPCLDAPCRTADNRRGAACCRDLTLEVLTPECDGYMEALLRARKSPYLCKVSRESPEIVECEVISACGYLEDDGITCALHDRLLPNGRLAKPSICMEWPDLGPDDTGHPGCVLLETNREGSRRHRKKSN